MTYTASFWALPWTSRCQLSEPPHVVLPPCTVPLFHVISPHKRHLSNDSSGPPEVTCVSPDCPPPSLSHIPSSNSLHLPDFLFDLTSASASLTIPPFLSLILVFLRGVNSEAPGRAAGLSKYGTSTHQVHRTHQRTLPTASNSMETSTDHLLTPCFPRS